MNEISLLEIFIASVPNFLLLFMIGSQLIIGRINGKGFWYKYILALIAVNVHAYFIRPQFSSPMIPALISLLVMFLCFKYIFKFYSLQAAYASILALSLDSIASMITIHYIAYTFAEPMEAGLLEMLLPLILIELVILITIVYFKFSFKQHYLLCTHYIRLKRNQRKILLSILLQLFAAYMISISWGALVVNILMNKLPISIYEPYLLIPYFATTLLIYTSHTNLLRLVQQEVEKDKSDKNVFIYSRSQRHILFDKMCYATTVTDETDDLLQYINTAFKHLKKPSLKKERIEVLTNCIEIVEYNDFNSAHSEDNQFLKKLKQTKLKIDLRIITAIFIFSFSLSFLFLKLLM